MNNPKIWLVGAGAIGSVIAIKLDSDPPCRLIDSWTEHVEAIRTSGLEVDRPDGLLHALLPAFHFSEIERIGEQPDVILLAVKSYSTAESLERLLPFMTDETVVVSLQNGVNEDEISRLIGAHRTIGAVVGLGGELISPGKARGYALEAAVTIGELDGSMTPRLDALAALLRTSVPVKVTGNIWGALWSKLVVNAQMNALAALTGLWTDAVAADPATRRIAVEVAREAFLVARGLGIVMDPDFIEEYVGRRSLDSPGEGMPAAEGRFSARWSGVSVRPSMLQDASKARPTEIDFLNGYIAQKAKAAGVDAPVNEAVVRLARDAQALGSEGVRKELDRIAADVIW